MKKIKAFIGFKLVCFGIRVLESGPYGMLTNEDKHNLRKLWALHDGFKEKLK